MTKKATTQDYLVVAVVMLIGFTLLNFSADWIFRAGQIELNESMLESWVAQVGLNDNQANINVLIAEVLKQLDEDVRSNMKVVDQLIGIVMRGEV